MSKNVIVVAGPNGSGKTTFAREYLRDSEVSEYISADAIAERLVSRPEDEVAFGEGDQLTVIDRDRFELFIRDIRSGGA